MNKYFLIACMFSSLNIVQHRVQAQNNNIAQVNISITIPQLAGKQILIGYPFWGKVYISDTVALDQKGQGILAPAAGMEKGIYKLIWPPASTYAEFIIDDEKRFSINLKDTTDFINHLVFEGSQQNQLYYDYLRFLLNKKREIALLGNNRSLSKEIKEDKISQVEELIKSKQDSLISSNNGLLFAETLKLVADFGVTNKTDYYEYRKQYLANINVSDLRLSRTDALYEKIITYIEQLNADQPDSTFAACVQVIEKSRPQPLIFQALVTNLLNKYAGSRLIFSEDVYAMLANRYYVQEKPEWVDEETRKKIEKQAKAIMPNLIGRKAPAFSLKDITGKKHSLHKIDHHATVLFFYNADDTASASWLQQFGEVEKKYRSHNLAFVTVMLTTKSMHNALQLVTNSGLTNTINLVAKEDKELINNYNILNGFKVVVLNNDHNIYYKNISIDNIRVVLDQYLNLKQPGH